MKEFALKKFVVIKYNINDLNVSTRCSSSISVVPPIAYAYLLAGDSLYLTDTFGQSKQIPLAACIWLYPINESLEERDCGESSNLSGSTFSIPPVSKELAKLCILFKENKLLIDQKIFAAR